MVWIRSLFPALLIALWAGAAYTATNTVSGNAAGTNSGEINISGTAVKDAGYTLQPSNTTAVVIYPSGTGGGVILPSQGVTINTTTGVWSATLKGLTPGGTYTLVVQVVQKDACNNIQTIASGPVIGIAKK